MHSNNFHQVNNFCFMRVLGKKGQCFMTTEKNLSELKEEERKSLTLPS